MMTYAEIKNNPQIRTYIQKADESLVALGYTEHSFAHVTRVAAEAKNILAALGYDAHTQELAQIAGYLHDIGNIVNRIDHAQSGAVMAFRLLDKLGFDPEDISTIVSAIGNHDESTAYPVNPVAAALILSDKTDVRRSRVRNHDIATFDIHDRVNYAVEKARTTMSEDKKSIILTLTIDTSISAVMDYFEIFLTRMMLCRKAAEKLGLRFRLVINGSDVL
jgi:putative nucleotidyltransferase with HDIG domain